eukprot:TRINITY_DN104212_c0_g1_i1.p1 TRINITY_DN104212_c0_g1~~TRINITY_DN104212_c0_g1_i1.p1  ORF type:complete len:684 (+),score=104.90 TRINITY_DN104212_c0_g1_i1:217-2052(+)
MALGGAASKRCKKNCSSPRQSVLLMAQNSKQPAYPSVGVLPPHDVPFDPLEVYKFEAEYIDEVLQNLNFSMDRMQWYREAELMHGRVAMLATSTVLLRDTLLPDLPRSLLDSNSVLQFLQMMICLEAYRGWRMFSNRLEISGDLGLGSWQANDPNSSELVDGRYKEMENGRVAMLASVGLLAQYWFTGQELGLMPDQINQVTAAFGASPLIGIAAVGSALSLLGVQTDEASQLTYTIGSATLSQMNMVNTLLSCAAGGLAIDGVRRISSSTPNNSIASKTINLFKLKFGVQDPCVPLPSGVVSGQLPQRLELSEAQLEQFEEDGVIMIKGGMKAWVDYLQAITDHQIENPHVWSLVGRMSGMYDYIQRNMWMTNDGFRDFLYYSPLGHILAQVGRSEDIRVSTDMLLVNPNKGFGWHQDNQNGPIDFPDALRWWVAMDRCGHQDFGAPEYIYGSHKNKSVSDEAVFVNLEDGDLSNFTKRSKFVPEPGDLIIWDARTIHRIVAPPGQSWAEGMKRRALGGTAAKSGAVYLDKGGASAISDLAGHDLQGGQPLGGPYFPRIYPSRVESEENIRVKRAIVDRDPGKMAKLAKTLVGNASKYVSFTKVVGDRRN